MRRDRNRSGIETGTMGSGIEQSYGSGIETGAMGWMRQAMGVNRDRAMEWNRDRSYGSGMRQELGE